MRQEKKDRKKNYEQISNKMDRDNKLKVGIGTKGINSCVKQTSKGMKERKNDMKELWNREKTMQKGREEGRDRKNERRELRNKLRQKAERKKSMNERKKE